MPQPSSRLQARYGSDSVPAEIALNPLIEHLLDHRQMLRQSRPALRAPAA